MNVTIRPSIAHGTVAAPPSKSWAHRYLICAALAKGQCVVRNVGNSADVAATIASLQALGATITRTGNDVIVQGVPAPMASSTPLACNQSASTLRFLLPLCLDGQARTLSAHPQLLSRPLDAYYPITNAIGATIRKGEESVFVHGTLSQGDYVVQGSVSSQFVSGLLFALSRVGNSTLTVQGELVSRPYVDMTISALQTFGVQVEESNQKFTFRAPQTFVSTDVTVEGDWSNGAVYVALDALGGDISVQGLSQNSLQGDRVIAQYVQQIQQGGATVNVSQCPDLAPLLFVVSAFFDGATFTGTERLKHKESDRVQAMAQELQKCGVCVHSQGDTVTVEPKSLHTPNEPLNSHDDHRIVMALCVLCSRLGGTVTGVEAVQKSYPEFIQKLSSLGISLT